MAASKVPQITALFWIIKVLTTAMGEATSDYFAFKYDPIVVGLIGFVIFAVALAMQLWVGRYIAAVYWFAVVMVAVFGTMVADGLHIKLHVPYAVSSTLFGVSLAVVFVAWYSWERTLSIHSIRTRRRELFYWATVLATFALGTAVGDLTATTFGWGFLASGIVFTIAICIPGLLYRFGGLNPILAFWASYVLTRPLGASWADYLGLPAYRGGLGLGRGAVAIYTSIAIIILVGYLAVRKSDVEPEPEGPIARQPARHRRQPA